ncbi:MAG: hypothetical protein AAB467_00820 [Patescibacteria group bacterium]
MGSTSQFLFILEALVFLPIVLIHLTKKNTNAVWLYLIQSAAVSSLLLISSFDKISFLLLVSLGSTILVKIFVAPWFFFRLIKRHHLKFSASTQLNTPITLFVIAAILYLNQTVLSGAFATFSSSDPNLLLISSAGIFISLFILINRRGVLSQMLGILSLENCIVTFAIFAGLEQNPGLQFGIIFDILIWIIIANVFASMIYNHFGSLDVTEMKKLTE